MRKKILNLAKNKIIFISLIILTSIYLMPINVKANTYGYFVKCVLDEGSFGILMQILTDKGSSVEGGGILEHSNRVTYQNIRDYKNVKKVDSNTDVENNIGSDLIIDFVFDTGKEAEDFDNMLEYYNDRLNNGLEVSGSKADETDMFAPLVFTFPGKSQLTDTSVTYTANTSDYERALLVSETLSKGLNDALNFIKYHSGKEYISTDGLRAVLAGLASTTSSFGENSGTSGGFYAGEEIGKRINVSQVYESDDTAAIITPVNGLRYSDYLKISMTGVDGNIYYSYFPWRMEKGYSEGQELYELVKGNYGSSGVENKYLTWGQFIIQAMVNADVDNSTSIAEVSDMSTLISSGMGLDLTSTISSIRSMLNLASIQELILNMGNRNGTHYLGIMTPDMYETAKSTYALIFAISALFLSVLIIKMIHQKMISTTNIIARTSLMEGLQDIFFVGVMLAIFPGIFELMLEVNYWIVKTFSFSSSYLSAYGLSTTKTMGTDSLGSILISSMFLSVDVYINITYMIRSIVVSFLYAIAPLMAVSYCWGDSQKQMYFSYLRELVGNIFMQSFHAITMCFFSGYNSTNLSTLEAVASIYCFIPMTQLFRSLVIGGSAGSFSERIGGKLSGQLINTASSIHRSNVTMRQSKEMQDQLAENYKNTALTSFGNSLLYSGTNLAVSGLNTGLSKNDIGTSPIHNASSASVSSQREGTGAMLAGGVGLLTSAQASKNAYNTEKSNYEKLGQLQMQHGTENIGISLAEAGIGMGLSSFEAGSAASGIANMEDGANTYGRGAANAGGAGGYKALEAGYEAQSKFMKSAYRDFDSGVKDYKRENDKYQDELAQKEKNLESMSARKISNNTFWGALGVRCIRMHNKIDIKPQKNTNNIVVKMDSSTLNGTKIDNDALKYISNIMNQYNKASAAQGGAGQTATISGSASSVNSGSSISAGTSSASSSQGGAINANASKSNSILDSIKVNDKLLEKAKKSGLSAEFGGGKGFTIDEEGNISFILKNINERGIAVDSKGNKLTVSDIITEDALNSRKNNLSNKGNNANNSTSKNANKNNTNKNSNNRQNNMANNAQSSSSTTVNLSQQTQSSVSQDNVSETNDINISQNNNSLNDNQFNNLNNNLGNNLNSNDLFKDNNDSDS